jgi:hypothetical protein
VIRHDEASRLRPWAGLLACAFVGVAIGADAIGCGRDHSLLASTSSGGNSPVTTSSAGSTGGSGGVGGAGGTGNEGGQPPGPSRLTVLDAVVDEDAVRFCFVPYPAGDPAAVPWPGTSGLAFGAAKVIDASANVIPKSTDVLAIVIGGDLSQTAGKTCDEIVAAAGMSGGSGGGGGQGGGGSTATLIAFTLGVLPEALFTSKKSLLLAPAGCLGGNGHEDSNAPLICGAGYQSDAPTARLVALSLSRRVFAPRLALQVAQASVATPELMVQISPSNGETAHDIAEVLPFGAADPPSGFVGFASANFNKTGSILTYSQDGGQPLSMTSLGDALATGDAGALLDNHAYTFVAIGPSPQFGAGSWWHKFTWTSVRSDP